MTSQSRAWGAQPQLPTTVGVRVSTVGLATGAGEGVGTDLLEAQTSPLAECKAGYGWRWNQETDHDRIKNSFEGERFSGNRVQASEQGFSGVSFLATVESSLSKPAPAQLKAQGQVRGGVSPPPGNRAVSYGVVLEHGVRWLGDALVSPAQT